MIMIKRILITLISLLIVSFPVKGWTASIPSIGITGVVRQPLNLSMDDLRKFESVSVRLNEVTVDKSFHGVFLYRGVPLKTILELATVQKEETDFIKPIDLAIKVRNREGKQTVLSWGEVFYRNPSDVVIAFSATPIMPHRDCTKCHKPEVYEPWFNQLKRQVGFPKLVVANDFYTDRCIEDITNIEVVDLHPKMDTKKLPSLFSQEFTLSGAVKVELHIADLSSHPHIEILAKQTGDGKGYHGLKHFRGVPLAEILKKANIKPDINTVLLISAPDGYRSLVSYSELFLSPFGQDIIVADMVDDKPIKENGKFMVVMPHDLSADRWVKAVDKIEAISLEQQAKLYIIGIGCADTSLITLEAISFMGKSDVFVSTEDISKRFAKYMGNKRVLFDPLMNAEAFFRKKNPNLSEEEMKKKLKEQRAKSLQMIRDALGNGKNVGFLEYGDPTIYGSWTYWLQEFIDNIEIVSGLSAFNESNALIKRHYGCNGSIVLTVPKGLRDNEQMLKAVAENGDTLVVFIGLKEMKNLMPLFRKYYPEETPVIVVYRAGYSDSERVVKTTFATVMKETESESEKHLGMIYIGPCLK
jgi:precorrin-4 methylase/DMSO/TMAO reductase YedYZ molybdopterin-dependent catalytic subunit